MLSSLPPIIYSEAEVEKGTKSAEIFDSMEEEANSKDYRKRGKRPDISTHFPLWGITVRLPLLTLGNAIVN